MNDLKQNSYSVGDTRIYLSEILERIGQTGEEIVLTRRGKPVAKVVSDRGEGGARQLGFARSR